jgi:hypothetical protein
LLLLQAQRSPWRWLEINRWQRQAVRIVLATPTTTTPGCDIHISCRDRGDGRELRRRLRGQNRQLCRCRRRGDHSR